MSEGVQCSDAGLQVAMASIHTDMGANSKCNDFEASVAYLLPYDPIVKRHVVGSKHPPAEVSEATMPEMMDAVNANSCALGMKPDIGQTGAHLQYFKKAEYEKLTRE